MDILLYATYDFAAGSEYDTFAALEDRDALRGGTMPGALEVNGVPGFVRFQPSLCYGACWMYRTVVFPFETSYVAVVYKVGAYNVEADWSALEQALQDGAYPPERGARCDNGLAGAVAAFRKRTLRRPGCR
jgi:hypothetical protein